MKIWEEIKALDRTMIGIVIIAAIAGCLIFTGFVLAIKDINDKVANKPEPSASIIEEQFNNCMEKTSMSDSETVKTCARFAYAMAKLKMKETNQ